MNDANLHLEPSFLRALRKVWQGRVTVEPRRGSLVFLVDDKPASVMVGIELHLLLREGYVEHFPLLVGDEWARVVATEFGDQVLAHHGADQERFRDLTAAEARALVAAR